MRCVKCRLDFSLRATQCNQCGSPLRFVESEFSMSKSSRKRGSKRSSK
jgi:predicted amidophosphoribosyltransferase